ncbi:MAG: OmpA family protein, partial [Verrucomicrobiales bacterium]
DALPIFFVSRENLSPRATALFRELVALEGKSADELAAPYQRIGTDLNASVVDTMRFESGRADIDFQREDQLKKAVTSAPGKAFFLVVGYASKTGETEANRELSAQRATRVASVVNYLKQQGQEVQAVYFGETDRFGSEAAPNQAVELWEIRP